MTESRVPYEIVRPLACGGMGWVYEGRAILPWGDKEPVAIKVMRRAHDKHGELVELFHNEALTSLRLNHNHPNLVTTYACSALADGRPYLVMEYVDGVSLADLTRDDVADPEEYYAVLRRVACATLRGLSHLHTHGVIHRDVSPGNILLGTSGDIKLADMGLSKALDSRRSQCFRGTPSYASPESLQGGQPAESFDLFSLAAVLYERLTGNPPYGTGTPQDILQRMGNTEPGLPDMTPPDLTELVLGLLAPDVQDRAFHSALECLAFLQAKREPIADDSIMSDLVKRLAPRIQGAIANEEIEIPTLSPEPKQSETEIKKRKKLPLSKVAVTVAVLALCVLVLLDVLRGGSTQNTRQIDMQPATVPRLARETETVAAPPAMQERSEATADDARLTKDKAQPAGAQRARAKARSNQHDDQFHPVPRTLGPED